ncbi:hypothetical protein BLEM_0700 [Bifidobacterium lemurum]|uniref:Uncharacterized protein n=1 Tax=Bifidobacterium lemurum TaxID=1603886 RepID=A0A261FSI4_9BIFI|nr:hypothetical protein BLEM_0700 [Bifidobacterium lemurum]
MRNRANTCMMPPHVVSHSLDPIIRDSRGTDLFFDGSCGES